MEDTKRMALATAFGAVSRGGRRLIYRHRFWGALTNQGLRVILLERVSIVYAAHHEQAFI